MAMVNGKHKLAFIVICGDELKWIPQFVESILKAKPDYVCVSVNGTDGSYEKFIECIPKDILIIERAEWKHNFSEARNRSLNLVPNDAGYVFYLDLDEILTADSYEPLDRFLRQPQKAICLTTILNALESADMCASLFYPRCFPFDRSLRFSGRVHNQINLDQTLPIVRPGVTIYHYGYALDKEEMAKKHKRSEDLLRAQIKENSDSFFSHLNLAQLLRAQGRFKETLEHALKVLDIIKTKIIMEPQKYTHAKLMALDQAATCYIALKKFDEAIKAAEEALVLKPDYLDAIMDLANTYLEIKNFDKAEFWLKRYLFIRSRYNVEKDNSNLILNHLNSSFIVLYHLGVVYGIREDIPKACEYFKKSYNESPTFRDVIIKYLHSLKLLGNQKEFDKEINIFMQKQAKLAFMVYEYLSDLELEQAHIENAKFNLYQATHMCGENKPEYERIKNKWTNLTYLFGDISPNFFDTADKQRALLQKVQ